jgi:ATP-dependent DNA helicase RecG
MPRAPSARWLFRAQCGLGKKQLPLGEKRWVAGRLDQFGQGLQIVHPDHVTEEGGAALGQLTEAVYPLSEGITQGRLAALVQQALAHVEPLPEWIEPGVIERMGWPAWREALAEAHRGEHKEARDRLAYDELLANSLALMLVRASNRRAAGQPCAATGGCARNWRCPSR